MEANGSRRVPWHWLKDGIGRAVLRGSGVSFVVSVLGMGISAVLHLCLARVLGGGDYGNFAYVFSWVATVALLANLGFESSVVRFAPEYEHLQDWKRLRGLVQGSIGISFGTAVLPALVFFLIPTFSGSMDPSLARTFFVAGFAIPLTAILLTMQGLMRSFRRIALSQSPILVIRPAIFLILLGIAIATGVGELSSSLSMAMFVSASAGALLLAAVFLRRMIPAGVFKVSPELETKRWIRTSFPMLLLSGMRMMLSQSDVILVGLLVGTTEAGIYAISSRLTAVMMMGQTSGNVIAAPLISSAWTRQDRNEIQKVATFASWISALVALSVGLVLILADAFILQWVGPTFARGATIVTILAVGQLINALTGPVGQLLNMTGNQDENARIGGFILVSYLTLSIPVISAFGIYGAAVLRALLIAAKNLWSWSAVRRSVHVNSSIFSMFPLVGKEASGESS